jgi:hypothetical protein
MMAFREELAERQADLVRFREAHLEEIRLHEAELRAARAELAAVEADLVDVDEAIKHLP